MNEELKKMEFDHTFFKKFKLLVDRFGKENDPSKEKIN